MVRMSVKDYATVRNISVAAVTKAIRKGHAAPGIVNYEKFNGDYILYVDENQVVKRKPKRISKKD